MGARSFRPKNTEFAKCDNTLVSFQLTRFPTSSGLKWFTYCWREGLSWVAPIEKLFHLMSSAISLDNQTFLAGYVDSFINFFQSQNSYSFLYFSFISQRIWYKCGGGFRGLGPGGVSLLGGATCRGLVHLGSVCLFKKTIKPSWSILLVKDQFIQETISTS